MQTTGKLVVLVRELAAGVQRAENHLHAWPALHGVDIHGHAAAVVAHRDGAIPVQYHIDTAGVSGEGLINAVVDNFLGEVIGACGIGVHAGALAHRLKPGEDFNVFRGVIAHACLWFPETALVGRAAL